MHAADRLGGLGVGDLCGSDELRKRVPHVVLDREGAVLSEVGLPSSHAFRRVSRSHVEQSPHVVRDADVHRWRQRWRGGGGCGEGGRGSAEESM
eukprot:741687-Pleurochrysis_carterae.AAC.1